MIKFALSLIGLMLVNYSWATCTAPIARTNNSANAVLTSTKYNTDLNTVYNHTNELNGDCLESGTVPLAALDTTEFTPVLKGVKEGCKVSYSNASTLSVGKCLASVNGTFVYTTIATAVSFGCTNCSSEVASTAYYVYIATGSSATALTLLILTTAPNEDGYDNSGNKVLGRFYNNGSSNIDQYSIEQWNTNQFLSENAIKASGITRPKECIYAFGGASATLTAPTECTSGTCVEVYDSCATASPPSWATIALYSGPSWGAGTWANSKAIHCKCNAYDTASGTTRICSLRYAGADSWATNTGGGYSADMVVADATGTQGTAYVVLSCTSEAP